MGSKFFRRSVTCAIQAWRAYWWFKAAVFAVLFAFFGGGPWAASMNWLTDFETWFIVKTAHPLVLAFLFGLMLSTWIIPDVWRWWKRESGRDTVPVITDLQIHFDENGPPEMWLECVIRNPGPATVIRNWQLSVSFLGDKIGRLVPKIIMTNKDFDGFIAVQNGFTVRRFENLLDNPLEAGGQRRMRLIFDTAGNSTQNPFDKVGSKFILECEDVRGRKISVSCIYKQRAG